jgi:hypothetical protein
MSSPSPSAFACSYASAATTRSWIPLPTLLNTVRSLGDERPGAFPLRTFAELDDIVLTESGELPRLRERARALVDDARAAHRVRVELAHVRAVRAGEPSSEAGIVATTPLSFRGM